MNNISRWANTAAVQTTDCPKCKSTKGVSCKTPKGKKTTVHVARSREYRRTIGAEEWSKRHTVKFSKLPEWARKDAQALIDGLSK